MDNRIYSALVKRGRSGALYFLRCVYHAFVRDGTRLTPGTIILPQVPLWTLAAACGLTITVYL
jgi:hypothetical protein